MDEVPRREETRFVATIYPGEACKVLPDGSLLIVHPDRPPQIVPPGEQRLLPPEE